MLKSMEERELQCPEARPLIGWRLFRVRWSESGFVLSAPLIHNPDFERFPSRTIEATCYGGDHPAPAPGCRCGLYAAIEGTLDSLSGYLSDSAHDDDPPIYAEVACTLFQLSPDRAFAGDDDLEAIFIAGENCRRID